MSSTIKIGTRDSELAIWQASRVKELLSKNGYSSTLVSIKSEGDIDLQTPLYEMGVQGIFTRSLDIALLNNTIDIAVHSMKDVPTQLPEGIVPAAVLERGNYKDLFVFNDSIAASADISDKTSDSFFQTASVIATSSIRRKAQWLNRYPDTTIENLRGNVNLRLKKLKESSWNGAIFAAAGLERINKRPVNSVELDWMLPAPAQGAIMVVCRKSDESLLEIAAELNHQSTALCANTEREFLRELLGGCSTPISALALLEDEELLFKGNILSVDGSMKASIEQKVNIKHAADFGKQMALKLLENGGRLIAESIRNAK